jgi:hypothetical protein
MAALASLPFSQMNQNLAYRGFFKAAKAANYLSVAAFPFVTELTGATAARRVRCVMSE